MHDSIFINTRWPTNVLNTERTQRTRGRTGTELLAVCCAVLCCVRGVGMCVYASSSHNTNTFGRMRMRNVGSNCLPRRHRLRLRRRLLEVVRAQRFNAMSLCVHIIWPHSLYILTHSRNTIFDFAHCVCMQTSSGVDVCQCALASRRRRAASILTLSTLAHTHEPKRWIDIWVTHLHAICNNIYR